MTLGRGPVATADMKNRLAALRTSGADIIDVLWHRFAAAHPDEPDYDLADHAGTVRPVTHPARLDPAARFDHRLARQCVDVGA